MKNSDIMRLSVKVIPNSKKTEIVKHDINSMIVRIAAKPEKNEANKILLGFLSDYFGKNVKLVRDPRSKDNVIEVS